MAFVKNMVNQTKLTMVESGRCGRARGLAQRCTERRWCPKVCCGRLCKRGRQRAWTGQDWALEQKGRLRRRSGGGKPSSSSQHR